MLTVDFISLFPDMIHPVVSASILARASAAGLVEFGVTDFREYADNKHKSVDDTPYGGGGGMVLKPEPLFLAVEDVVRRRTGRSMGSSQIILTCPQGQLFTQQHAAELSQEAHLIFICGHYEGYDERIRQHLITHEFSIGDYVLTGGELPALVMADSIVRLLPGALGNEHSACRDSFQEGLLEHPHYTRPYEFRGWTVPDILMSGHHENIDRWRRKESIRRTLERRPDLLQKSQLSPEDQLLLEEIRRENA
ncbi:MAG: trmD [Bacilli bacterium]|nr:trmD [Bacilli bacterium]